MSLPLREAFLTEHKLTRRGYPVSTVRLLGSIVSWLGFALRYLFRTQLPVTPLTAAYDKSCEKPLTHVAYRGGMATKEKIENNKRLKLMEISESF